jgi:hypothetical protein
VGHGGICPSESAVVLDEVEIRGEGVEIWKSDLMNGVTEGVPAEPTQILRKQCFDLDLHFSRFQK